MLCLLITARQPRQDDYLARARPPEWPIGERRRSPG